MVIPSDEMIEHLCEVQHEAHETALLRDDWDRQERARVLWVNVPESSKVAMRESVRALLAALPSGWGL